MAKDKSSNNNIMNNLSRFIRSNLDSLYTSTYYSSPKNKRDLENLKDDINKSISNIISNNNINTGMPNISALYGKIVELSKDPNTSKDFEELFNDNKLLGSITEVVFQNQGLVELDREIDTICKYMPELLEALEIRKDNVLSADHFSKEFINIKNKGTTEVDTVSFYARIEEIKTKYNLERHIDEWYDNASKYGEQFVYCIPYTKALSKLINNRNSLNNIHAQLNCEQKAILSESGNFEFDTADFPTDLKDVDLNKFNINLELNMSNMIEEPVLELKKLIDTSKNISNQSVYKSFMESLDDDSKSYPRNSKTFDKTIDDELDFSGFEDTAQDGFIKPETKNIDDEKIHTRGCVLKTLERSHVIPIYIEDMCLGYYYFEFKGLDMRDPLNFDMQSSSNGTIPGLTTNQSRFFEPNIQQDRSDDLLRYISAQMSQYIDSKFINMNQDISKEIYMILKYNDLYNGTDNIRVSFIPPEDISHIYWKKDKKTNHGISDLEKALIPAILYICLYLTLAIAYMTRGQDKRVYYVKQNIETNIAKTLLNTIEQIKKGNFGIRQIQSINTMLNIVGRFNDYVIPVSQSGDTPIQFEVMQGQNIDTNPELLQKLKDAAINSTDVPVELIQARQSIDYAVQFTMTNSKFLRKVYNRQALYEAILSPLLTKIYNIEYNTNILLDVKLQPPLFLNITNTNQIINNTNEFSEAIANIVLADELDETVKTIAIKKLKLYYMSSYLNLPIINQIIEESRQEATKINLKNQNQE